VLLSGSQTDAKGAEMFTFQMRLADGTPADPPQFVSSEPNWRTGDPVRIGADVRFTITGISYERADGHDLDRDACPKRRLGGVSSTA
jgi:hypothetical protein